MSTRTPLSQQDLRIIETEDGSATLFHEQLGVHYRSVDGAAAESRYVFIDGCKILSRKAPWNVLELGFGGALNFCTLAELALEQNHSLQYTSIEHQPIPPECLPSCGNDQLDTLVKLALHKARQSHSPVTLQLEQITLNLLPMDRVNCELESSWADAVFFDPFGPHANPEAWTKDCFSWMHQKMRPYAILATFGAAGHARRSMAAAGLHIATRKGWGRKREMTLASPSITELTMNNHSTLISKYPAWMELP